MSDKVIKILQGLLVFFAFVVLLELGYYFYPRFFKPISVVSNIKGYSIQINDAEAFNKLLDDVDFRSTSNKSFYNYEEAKWQNYSSVIVNFTEIPQKYGKVVGGEEMELVSSFGQSLNKGSLNVNVYINQKYFSDKNTFREVSSDALIRSLFLTKHPEYYQNKEVETQMENLILQYITSGIKLLNNSNSQSSVYQSTLAFIEKNNIFKVKSAKAQSCYGSYECGTTGTLKVCSKSGAPCSICGNYTFACGTCMCTNNVCLDAGGAAQSCGGDSYADCTGSRCGTSGSCVYSGGCSWDSGGGGGGGGGTISCGTQTCNADTEVCCSTGCKPISEGCSAPPPPSGITMNIVVGLDKNRNGVFDDGYYQVIEDPGDVNCGTFPNISGLVINYSGAATGSMNYHTNCIGGAYNYPYSSQAISATGNFTFALANLPSNYTLKWTEEATGKCTLSGGVVNCNGLVGGQTYGLWFLLQEAPICTISFNSPNYSMSVGSSQTAGTNVTFSNGTISSVNFASSNTGIATVNPASDTGNPYTTSITGVSGGSSTVTANVIMSGVSRCSATTAVSVTSNPWWQVKDSDVATNLDLRSTVPSGLVFGKNGDGGYPGVAVYGTSTNLTKPNVSATGWLVNTTYSTSKIYDSNYFVNSIPGDAVINPVSSSSVAGSFFASGGTAYNGYYWYVYDGSAMGGIPLTISSAANLGTRKVILIVKGANLSIKGNIKLTKGSGFFLAVAGENTTGSYGNITVDPGVGGGGFG